MSDSSKRDLGTAKIGHVMRQYLSDDWEVVNHNGRAVAAYRGSCKTSEDRMKREMRKGAN